MDPDPGEVFRLLEGVCAGGDVEACAHLGSMLRRGVGVPKDEERAESVLDDVCSKGSARARSLFRRACEGGYGEACAKVDAVP